MKNILLFGLMILFFIHPNYLMAQESYKSSSVTTKVGNPSPSPSLVIQPNPGGGSGEFVYYCQKDARFNDSCSYEWAICGPTSLAMVMSSLGRIITPKEVDSIFVKSGWRACGDAPSYMTTALESQWLKDEGFKSTALAMPLNLEQAKELLNNNFLIIASVRPHIFVIDDVNPSDGTVHLRDPDKTCNPAGYWASSRTPWIFQGVPQSMIYAYAIKKVK